MHGCGGLPVAPGTSRLSLSARRGKPAGRVALAAVQREPSNMPHTSRRILAVWEWLADRRGGNCFRTARHRARAWRGAARIAEIFIESRKRTSCLVGWILTSTRSEPSMQHTAGYRPFGSGRHTSRMPNSWCLRLRAPLIKCAAHAGCRAKPVC